MARYVEVLFRHWWQFLILLFLLPGAVTAASIAIFGTYQASAALWVDSPSSIGIPATPSGWNQYLTPAQNEQDSLNQMLRTRSFLSDLGDRLTSSGTITTRSELSSVLGSVARQLKVTPAGSHLVTINFSCERAAVCVAAISGTIELFHQRLAKQQQDQADIASSFYASEIDGANIRLKAAEGGVDKYLADHPQVSLAESQAIPELDLLVRQVSESRAEIDSLRQKAGQAAFTGAAALRLVQSISSVIDPPRLSERGLVNSGSIKRAALAVIAFWAAGAAYLVVLTWLDRTARDPRELERRLRVPVLVTIPHFAHMGRA